MSEKPAILYVDDEEANLLLFRLSFEGDREVLLANSAEEGLQKLIENKGRIRAVISDMHMPEMNGVQFVKKAQETVADIPYYILSGYAFNDEINDALEHKTIQRFFTKPFDRQEIENQLSRSA